MTSAERERRCRAVLDAAAPDWRERDGRTDAVAVRAIDAGGKLLVIAHVPDRAERRRFLSAIREHFADAPVRFTP